MLGSSTLGLCCGTTPHDPFREKSLIILLRLTLFIKHVPRIIYTPDCKLPFIQLMNEIWGTLKDGGIFFSFTPAYPFKAAFNDPMHVNYITEETFDYFNDGIRLGSMYGFTGKFKVLEQYRTHTHLVSILKKIKI